MQARIAQRPDILDKRHETVEHPFGSIKQWMNQGAFLMRGLEKVRGEFSLTALAYNLRRVLNIVELPKLTPRSQPKSYARAPSFGRAQSNVEHQHVIAADKAAFPHGLQDFCIARNRSDSQSAAAGQAGAGLIEMFAPVGLSRR
jgi:hypothetical protein